VWRGGGWGARQGAQEAVSGQADDVAPGGGAAADGGIDAVVADEAEGAGGAVGEALSAEELEAARVKAEQERLEAERKAEEERLEAERKAKEEKIAAVKGQQKELVQKAVETYTFWDRWIPLFEYLREHMPRSISSIFEGGESP